MGATERGKIGATAYGTNILELANILRSLETQPRIFGIQAIVELLHFKIIVTNVFTPLGSLEKQL